ncbi:MAG: glycosyltransferase family 4 protein [Candidatus Acidiferrales bacterium]
MAVALLTGGSDKSYVYGLGTTLSAGAVTMDIIGSDELDTPEIRDIRGVKFFNLRGSQDPDAGFGRKILRIVHYYVRLIAYTATSKPKIFHILWNNKFEVFDRTLLTLWYRLLRKKIVLTAHNVNAGKRDASDTLLNRASLRFQYRLADRIFVHTEKMKRELTQHFGVHQAKAIVIPFGINDSIPKTQLSPSQAKELLGIERNSKTVLFFGRITPYKGLEYLIGAFKRPALRSDQYRLIVAGRVEKGCETYWEAIREQVREEAQNGRIVIRDEFIPDCETEVYFKAADALVLPYRDIFQSGVMFLAYSFGLPVLAADVGSLKEDIIEGRTGFVFKPEDPADLVRTIERYFASDLFTELHMRRQEIRDNAIKSHSWDLVGEKTLHAYAGLLGISPLHTSSSREVSSAAVDVKSPS